MNPSVAIVGGGMAGATAARDLATRGVPVHLFDKGRGLSGRASTRYAEGDRRFDHGAQYFTTRSDAFAAEVNAWAEAGVASQWNGRIATVECNADDGGSEDGAAGACRRGDDPPAKTRWVGTPGMNAPARRLAEQAAEAGAEVRIGVRVAPLKRSSGAWRLMAESGDPLGEFSHVLVTAPAPQAAELLTPSPALSNAAKSVRTTGCWAAMIALAEPVAAGESGFDGAFVNPVGLVGGAGSGDVAANSNATDSGSAEPTVLSWIARDGSKPGRPDPATAGDCWVLHGSPGWSEAYLELDADAALARMLEAFWQAVGERPQTPVHAATHRWRFALPETPLPDAVLADASLGLYAAGDWCGGPRVEGAYLSGRAAAEAIAASID